MHKRKINLVCSQIRALQEILKMREIESIYFVACGGSLATLYPGKYIIERETNKVSTNFYNAAEFFCDPPVCLNEKCLVFLNSQSGSTAETISAAKLAAEKGALTAAFTTKPDSSIEQVVNCPIYYYDDPADPYPALLTIFPEVYQATFAVLDVLNGTNKLADIEKCMAQLQNTFDTVCQSYRPLAQEFAAKNRNESMIYTISAGLDSCVGYILTNCLFMESIWINSSPLHAGEFFHGALEAIDQDTSLFVFLGLGKTRSIEERAVKFLQRKTKKITVLDAKGLDLSDYPSWTHDYIAPLVLNRLAALYCDELAYLLGHPISSRRYMGVEKY